MRKDPRNLEDPGLIKKDVPRERRPRHLLQCNKSFDLGDEQGYRNV